MILESLTHEVSGPPAEIGADLAKKYGVNYSSYRGILEHHSDEHETIESYLVCHRRRHQRLPTGGP